MTKEQYEHWEDYVTLMEHIWNTSIRTDTKRSPFELAHGLPARGVVDSLVPGPEYHHPAAMDSAGIKALSTTAKAFEEIAKMTQTRERQQTATKANAKGASKTYKVGDKVTFFIPPTAAQAKVAGRKPKHLPNFRGPASVVEILSETTYKLEYRGRTYKRSAAEL